MTKYIKGIDVSHWEPEIDWAKVQAQGFRFVFMKATQGLGVDPVFTKLWNGAKQAGMLRGAFHFIDPRIDGVAQAEAFLNTVKLEPGDFPPVLDMEDIISQYEKETGGKKGVKGAGSKAGGGKVGTKGKLIKKGTEDVSPAQIVACAEAWLKTVEQRTGRTPIIYSRAEYLINRMRVNSKPPSWSMNYPMWIAHYFTLPFDENVIVPNEANGWPRFTFWQYSEDGLVDGIYGDKSRTRLTEVDLNFFKGTVEQLYQLAGAPVPVADGVVEQPQVGVLEDVKEGKVVIPVDLPPAAPPPAVTPVTRPTSYCIEAGDNLSIVAAKFDLTLPALLAANPQIVNPNLIHPGEIINIPQA